MPKASVLRPDICRSSKSPKQTLSIGYLGLQGSLRSLCSRGVEPVHGCDKEHTVGGACSGADGAFQVQTCQHFFFTACRHDIKNPASGTNVGLSISNESRGP